jgi:hypothetical protein
MLPPLAPFTSLLDRGNLPNALPDHAKAHSSGSSKGVGSLIGRGQQHDSFAIFNEVLQKAYKRMAFSPTDAHSNVNALSPNQTAPSAAEIPGYAQVDKISSQQASDTILGFISQKLKMDEANGATQEELLQRLDQGLEGFIKGFSEAKDIIEGMGLLTPALAGEIGQTYERVTEGVEALRNGINGVETAPTNVNQLSLVGEHSDSKSFSLELTTQDGDRVSIDISRSSQFGFASSFQTGADSSSLSLSQQSSSSSSFSLNVTGDLDEGEMAAINQLLQDVDQIAGEFFQGNLDEAFNQALALNIDREELSSLNLQLQKTTTTSAIAAYESTAKSDLEAPQAQTASAISELNNLLDNIQNILQEAKLFTEPLKLMTDVANGVGVLNAGASNNEGQETHKASELSEMINALVSRFGLNN